MAKDKEAVQLAKAKRLAMENMRAIQSGLNACVSEGMIDMNNEYYNQVLSLMDEITLSYSWDELMEVVSKGKILEVDIAVWLSGHGRTSISLPWPKREGSIKR